MATVLNACFMPPATIHRSRIYSRRPLDMRARLLMRGERGKEEVVHGWMRDLSCSGAGMMLAGNVTPGAEVVLSMRLPNRLGHLNLRAVVRRHQGLRTGLEFLTTTPEQRLMLTELCYA
ncbi:MAG: PilZ domain-containing protein [Acidobacteriota bacterium]|nr:PilZ domain-containing protein [Acidobacteriota bacterium]